jgi:dGTPase
VVDVLEALNLTEPVRDGILHHSSGAGEPATLEGKIVRLVDRIAYINHDIDDALRAGVLAVDDLPREQIAVLGRPGRAGSTRWCTISSSTQSVLGTSCRATWWGRRCCGCARSCSSACTSGRRARAEHAKIERVLRGLFDWYCARPEDMPEGVEGTRHGDRVIDYLAGMTDRFAIRAWTERFVPQGFVA